MGIADFLLYPVYLLLFYYVFASGSKKLSEPILKVYHMRGFWIKALSAVPFALFNWKISPGDSYLLYHTEGANIYRLILSNFSNIHWFFDAGTEYNQSGLLAEPGNIGYFADLNNFVVCRFVTVISFFSFGKYLITCLFFSLISYSGIWRLYRFFYEQYPHLHKELAIAILYLPTFVFWSSGILKDPICTGAIGFITYSLYESLYKKKNIVINALIIIASGYLLSIVKVYILVSYVPFFLLFLALKNINLIRSTFAKVVIALGMLFGIMFSFTKIMNQIQASMKKFSGDDITVTIKNYQENYAAQLEAQSNFSLGVEYDGTLVSLIKMAPAAIVATFYRPFFWESKKPSTLLTSMESLAIIILTFKVLRFAGFRNFFAACKTPIVMYCILFSLFFGIFVGATTPNFGTLCRYKIPCMPFYVISMLLIRDIVKQKKESLLNTKQAVNV
jgi:hypothetical protein